MKSVDEILAGMMPYRRDAIIKRAEELVREEYEHQIKERDVTIADMSEVIEQLTSERDKERESKEILMGATLLSLQRGAIQAARDAGLEQAAKVAESFWDANNAIVGTIAARIRALKGGGQ